MIKYSAKKIILMHLIVIIAIALYIIILRLISATCIIKFIIGMPCPACGITRSLISLLTLNFKQSFYYHPLSVPIVIAVFLGIHSSWFKKGKKHLNIYIIIVAILTILCYILRIMTNTLP